ncbi:MAG: hypothetical protein ACREL1_07870 [bacterium]
MRHTDYFSEIFGASALSIPFYFIWNKLAPIYLHQIPQIYRQLPFWHCVGIFALVGILRVLICPSIYKWYPEKKA